jgi:hypothetical protein
MNIGFAHQSHVKTISKLNKSEIISCQNWILQQFSSAQNHYFKENIEDDII